MKVIYKRLIALFLLISFLFSLSACQVDTNKDANKIEGKGYKSADEAALAYAEALCQSDINSMLSTFAIESYIENYDFEEFLKTKKYYNYNFTECPFEGSSTFQKQINSYSRSYDIVNGFKQVYFALVLKDYNYGTMESFTKSSSDDIELFINQINDASFEEKASNAKIRRILKPETFTDMDLLTYKNAITTRYSYLNCDEITSFAIEFDFDDNEYYLFVDTCRFGDVWYNLSISSSLGTCVGASGNFSIMYR